MPIVGLYILHRTLSINDEKEIMYNQNSIVIVVVLFILIIGFYELGFRIGRFYR